MDEAGFRERLVARHLEPDDIERSVAMVRSFEEFLQRYRPAAAVDRATAGDFERFAGEVAVSAGISASDLVAIARYALFTQNQELLVGVLERVDGAEVPANLSRKLADLVGETRRDELLAGLSIPSVGAAPAEKNAFMRQLIERLTGQVDDATLATALKSGLHYEPKEAFAPERERYLAAPDLDSFIEAEHRLYLEFLAGLKDDGALYYTQPITDDVLAWVRDTPTCGPGRREGDVIHITKIPYQAHAYLHEADERRRRYLCCHCPWARESILRPGSEVPARFCDCSAGFEKQYWDAVFGQPVDVDVVKSALRGDLGCEFVVRLPVGWRSSSKGLV